MGVGAVRGAHLGFLNGANRSVREEHHYLRAGNVLEALQGRRSCVAGSGDQYHNSLFFLLLFDACCKQSGHQLKRHVLERRRGPVIELQEPGAAGFNHGDYLLRGILAVVGAVYASLKLLRGKLREIRRKHFLRKLFICHLRESVPAAGKLRKMIRDIESPVRRYALYYGAADVHLRGQTSCAFILHRRPFRLRPLSRCAPVSFPCPLSAVWSKGPGCWPCLLLRF